MTRLAVTYWSGANQPFAGETYVVWGTVCVTLWGMLTYDENEWVDEFEVAGDRAGYAVPRLGIVLSEGAGNWVTGTSPEGMHVETGEAGGVRYTWAWTGATEETGTWAWKPLWN